MMKGMIAGYLHMTRSSSKITYFIFKVAKKPSIDMKQCKYTISQSFAAHQATYSLKHRSLPRANMNY